MIHDMLTLPPTIRPLPDDWDGDALGRLGEILFQTSPASRRRAQIETFCQLAKRGELDRDGVLLAFAPLFVGAILTEVLPSTTGLIWLPQLIVSQSVTAIEDALVQAGIRRLQAGRVASIQAFLHPDEVAGGEVLLRNGLARMSRIWMMRRSFESIPPWNRTLEVQAVTEATLSEFVALLLATYEGSLDCPELNDGRSPEAILIGLRASAPNLDAWWFLRQDSQAIGVLILNAQSNRCDLDYLGLVPQFRNRGAAQDAVAFALNFAQQFGAPEIHLFVDERNQPAIKLYRKYQFEICGYREIYWLH
jgi:ribosomal protein S18 acetylase RimI-like enzyme